MTASARSARARRASPGDAPALRRFRCSRAGWFARDVQRLVRGRIATAVADGEADVILFEIGAELVALAVLEVDPSVPSLCDLHVVAIANEHQGSRVGTSAGELPLVEVVLDTALAEAAELGSTHMRTIVARDNARSLRMLSRQGFVRIGAFDKDYDEYGARLA